MRLVSLSKRLHELRIVARLSPIATENGDCQFQKLYRVCEE
jgi:hypothetical protein